MNYKKIILVDDNDTSLFYNQDVISDFFGNAEVVQFTDPNQFIGQYNLQFAHESNKSLVFLDLSMPQKYGFEVLDELESQHTDLNMDVIILTSSNLRSDIERSARFPVVVGYIEKPIDEKKLKAAMDGRIVL